MAAGHPAAGAATGALQRLPVWPDKLLLKKAEICPAEERPGRGRPAGLDDPAALARLIGM
eukprot:SAG22_NODE_10901_length_511_cov_0.611650_1_plen_60_part_00